MSNTDTPDTPDVPEVQETAPVTTESELPKWARDAITSANHEAAAARVEKTNALANAKTLVEQEYASKLAEAAESYAELEVKFAKASNRVAKLEAVLDAEIPSDRVKKMASLVQGSTEDEIKASVADIKEIFDAGSRPGTFIDHTQGTLKTPPALNGDGILEAVKRAVGAR